MKTYLIVKSYCLEVEDNYDPSYIREHLNFDNLKIDETHTAKWNELRVLLLDSRYHNCMKCSFCNSWISDINKDYPITGISKGVEIDGLYYCAQCLDEKKK